MVPAWKPAAYGSLSPYLMVTGAAKVIAFLQQSFGGTELRRFDLPDGTVAHAEVRLDDSVVMLAEASPEFPAFPVWLHLYVPDVDATYQLALASGGVAVQAPQQKQGDPDRRGGVKDPAGNTWWISTQAS
jgi:PhnB protein